MEFKDSKKLANGEVTTIETDNPGEIIKDLIRQNKSPKFDNLPSFTGGFVGYFAYDYIKYSEPSLNLDAQNQDQFKDIDIMLFDKVIAFDNFRQKIVIIVNIKTDDLRNNYRNACRELSEIADLIKNGEKAKIQPLSLESDFKPVFSREQYGQMVMKAKEYIKEGDIFQVVLSNRIEADISGSLFDTYRVLRTTNPSPYMFYFSSDDIEIVGASPETLVKLEDRKLYTFPLAGTRPRGKDEKEDSLLEEELLSDEKELAEHNMLVDLGRNDIGRISEIGSVKVEKYLSVEKFSHVMHIGSTVTGTLSRGRFGQYGGQYISETLMNELIYLEEQYNHYKNDPEFVEELNTLLKEYAGRPSLLYHAKRMSEDLGGAKIYLKREDLNHTGAHKINNVLGQVLLAKKMGKTRVIAETGAGQHGVATATAAALLDMECEIFMGETDTERQALNVYRMELLGAKVHKVTSGTKTLKDAVNEVFREWISRVHDTHYVIGSTMGPHPFPMIVKDFQSVISKEARQQILEKENKLPNAVIACVGGGSNAMGAFYNFIEDEDVKLIGCEAGGKGIDTPYNAAAINNGKVGIFHGMKSIFSQGEYGQIAPVYSISAGLDYPGIGPEHAHLNEIGRAKYVPVNDDEAVGAFEYLSRMEGIIPAIESAHAVAYAMKIAPEMDKEDIIVVCLSGRGDKDVASIARYKGVDLHE